MKDKKEKRDERRKTPPGEDSRKREFPPENPPIEEFLDDKAEWSEDVSEKTRKY